MSATHGRDVCMWHIPSIRGTQHFGRFRSEADIA